jgi:hypothetical protein
MVAVEDVQNALLWCLKWMCGGYVEGLELGTEGPKESLKYHRRSILYMLFKMGCLNVMRAIIVLVTNLEGAQICECYSVRWVIRSYSNIQPR